MHVVAQNLLRLTDSKKSQLGYAEGNGPQEATLAATFPADGDYFLQVRDLNRRGGPRYVYHIETTPTEADLSLSVSTDSLNIPAGGTAALTVTAHRLGYGGPIAIRAVDLPVGAVRFDQRDQRHTGREHGIDLVGAA